MSYDAGLVERVRDLLADVPKVTERTMFGGLVFMLPGGMCVGVRRDELLVRVGPEGHAAAVATKHARPMGHGKRTMTGFVFVGEEGTRNDADLERWVAAALAYVRTLSAKEPTDTAKVTRAQSAPSTKKAAKAAPKKTAPKKAAKAAPKKTAPKKAAKAAKAAPKKAAPKKAAKATKKGA